MTFWDDARKDVSRGNPHEFMREVFVNFCWFVEILEVMSCEVSDTNDRNKVGIMNLPQIVYVFFRGNSLLFKREIYKKL